MSFGATLRLLRLQSGLGLRDLARRLGVSSTYLSRIENDIDPAPTPARLANIAQELGVSATTLIEIARRVGPLLTDYVERVPEAGSLFADLALRKLNAIELAEIQRFVDRRFPRPRRNEVSADAIAPLIDLITEERLILGLRCARLADALQIAAGRLAANAKHDAVTIAAALMARENQIGSGVGNGVAVVCAAIPEHHPAAALITLSSPLVYPTPDQQPLRVLLAFVGPMNAPFGQYLAEVARLADRGLADALCKSTTATELLGALASLTGATN